jgi:Na+/melibiose symporter-like transporter
MIAIFIAAFINALPFPLATFGLLPEFGSWKLFFATAPFLFVTSTGLVASAIIRESMLGDISDEVQLNTGFGQQGLMFASSSFVGKLNTGLGILLSGLLLELINFPQGQDAIPDANQIFNLAFTQGPFVSLLMIIPFLIFYFYKIDRKRHDEIISEIKKKL